MAGLSLERRQADHRPPCLRDAALLSAAAPERPWQSLEVAALRRAAPCRNLPRCRTLPAIPFLGNAFLSPLAGILPSATPLQHTRFFAAMLWPVLIAPPMQSKSRNLALLKDQIAGLAFYLKAAEVPRLNALNPPEEDLAL